MLWGLMLHNNVGLVKIPGDSVDFAISKNMCEDISGIASGVVFAFLVLYTIHLKP